MANFTAQQADNCTFTRCESFKIDGVHQHWIIGVIDENNQAYEWEDHDMPGSADDTAIKAAAKATLMATEMKTVPPVKSVDYNETIIGDTIG